MSTVEKQKPKVSVLFSAIEIHGLKMAQNGQAGEGRQGGMIKRTAPTICIVI